MVSEVVLVAEALAPGFIEPSFGRATGRGVGEHLLCGLRDGNGATLRWLIHQPLQAGQ